MRSGTTFGSLINSQNSNTDNKSKTPNKNKKVFKNSVAETKIMIYKMPESALVRVSFILEVF